MKLDTVTYDDLSEIEHLQPESWPDIVTDFKFYLASAFCMPVKKMHGHQVVGIGAAIILGDSAWIAHIIVDKEFRNRGIGYGILRELMNKLKRFPLRSCSLIATEMGKSLYEKAGFIAQLLSIHNPDRVRSITSISSSTNSPQVPPPPARTWELFMENKPTGHFDQDLEGYLPVWEYLNGTAFFDKELAIDYTRKLYERQEIHGALGASHVIAQASLTDRTEQLKKVNIPALIIHGEEDYLVDKYGGIQTARSIQNSTLALIPKMGHVLFNKEIKDRVEDHIIQFLWSNK